MKKMSQNQAQLMILLLIIVLATVAYRFGYMEFHTKASSIIAENDQMEVRVAELESKMAQKDTYESGLKDSQDQLKAIYAKYAPGNTPEKSIIMLCDMEKQAQMSIDNITFGTDTGIYYSTKLKEDGTPEISLYNSQLSLTFETGYEGLKECIKYISSYQERMNVESFNVVYDQETGLLKGSMIVNQYSLVGNSTKYQEPVISDIEIGTDNIFGTYTAPTNNGQ